MAKTTKPGAGLKMGAEAVAHHARSAHPAGLGKPAHGTFPLLAGHGKGGPMSHDTGGKTCGGSRDYDPPVPDGDGMGSPPPPPPDRGAIAGIGIRGGYTPVNPD